MIFKGQYQNGKREGFGTCFEKERKVFEGNYKQNIRDGLGKTFHLETANVEYDGEWKFNVKHSQGKLYKSDGTLEYDGQWENNKRSGKGKLYVKNGELQYEGGWYNDKMHGDGVQYEASGSKYQGKWNNGKLKQLVKASGPKVS